MVLDDDDERLWLKRNGRFEAEVVPEREPDDPTTEEGDWKRLSIARRPGRVLRPDGRLRRPGRGARRVVPGRSLRTTTKTMDDDEGDRVEPTSRTPRRR